jgi:RNA polymerase sigma-70 factor, ECF subfamily
MSDSDRYEEFVSLLRLHTSQVLSYIRVLLLNWNDAEDLFQDTCLVLWQKFDEFTPGTNFLAWALRIAEHKVMDFQKKKSRRMAFTANLRDVLMLELTHQSRESATANLVALSGCMDNLTPSDRKMVATCYGDGVPVRQVADAMGRSPESVHRSLRRIRKWLLDCIRRELRRTDMPASVDRNILEEEGGP